MGLLETVSSHLTDKAPLQRSDTVVVGVSGGPDSICLLHVLLQLRAQLGVTVHAAHLNHRLRGRESDLDERYVRRVAAEWEVPLAVGDAQVAELSEQKRVGVEEAAREARYQFLGRVAGQVGARKVAVGHNADDQTETVLMHILRGSGLTGLRGMLPAAPYPLPGFGLTLVRPLLEVPRSSIDVYCREHGLQPRQDRTNLSPALFRNRLRHEVLPFLEQISPGVGGRLRQLAQVAAGDVAVLEQVEDEAWAEILCEESDQAVVLDLDAWRSLPLGLRRSTLRRSIARLQGVPQNLSFRHVEDARAAAERGATGARATLPGGLELMVSYDDLIVGAAAVAFRAAVNYPTLGARSPVPLAVPGCTVVPGTCWQVVARVLPANAETRAAAMANQDASRAYLDADEAGLALVLRPRIPGERFRPLGMAGKSSSVSDFMINARIPAVMRDAVPLLSVDTETREGGTGGRILWIVGWRLDERVKVTARTGRILLISFSRTEEGQSPEAGSRQVSRS